MSKHTPGPWIARDESKPTDDHYTPIRIYQDPATAGGYLLLFEASGDAPAEEEAANVRLVTAAPDMLAALRFAAIALESGAAALDQARGNVAAAMSQALRDRASEARAAIAKAEGTPAPVPGNPVREHVAAVLQRLPRTEGGK